MSVGQHANTIGLRHALWDQAEAHNFVSGPAACMVGKESRIFATSMAHRCPKTLLYQSGERPLRR